MSVARQVEQEEIDDQQHDRGGDHQRDLDLMDGAAHEDGIVAGDADVHAFRQVLLDVRDRRAHAIRDVERVGFGLPDDAEPDAGLAVRAQRGLRDVRPERYRRDVAEPVLVADHQRLELLRAW